MTRLEMDARQARMKDVYCMRSREGHGGGQGHVRTSRVYHTPLCSTSVTQSSPFFKILI